MRYLGNTQMYMHVCMYFKKQHAFIITLFVKKICIQRPPVEDGRTLYIKFSVMLFNVIFKTVT